MTTVRKTSRKGGEKACSISPNERLDSHLALWVTCCMQDEITPPQPCLHGPDAEYGKDQLGVLDICWNILSSSGLQSMAITLEDTGWQALGDLFQMPLLGYQRVNPTLIFPPNFLLGMPMSNSWEGFRDRGKQQVE